jgi:hypothetical protein
VACSTYLSGVISLMCALFLYLMGYLTDFVASVASGKGDVGGPFDSFRRLVTNQPSVPFDPSPTTRVAETLDEGFRWYLRRFLNILPDVDLFSLTDHVAQGFDISFLDLGLRLLVLVGYLLPWAVVAYYLMKSREVAT